MYSKGTRTLSEDLGYGTSPEGIKKAQAIYDAVLTAYPIMAQWMRDTEKKAFKTGYVDNMFGRRRRLPELLLPKYEILFSTDVPQSTRDYYTAVFTSKLNRARYRSEVERIKEEAYRKGIHINSNQKIIADKKRNIINFCVQGCLIQNSHVTTKEYGVVTIDNLEGKQFHIWDGENFVKAGCIYSGKKQKVRITLWDKRVIECSPNHQFLFKNNRGKSYFKTAGDLAKMKSNTKMLVVSGNTSDFSCVQEDDFPKLVEVKAHNANIYSMTDIEGEYELGYLMGWLHSDGSIKQGRECEWIFAENKIEILNFVQSIIDGHFKYSIRVETAEERQKHRTTNITESVVYLTVRSKTLAHQMLEAGIKHHIPKCVFKSKQMAKGFIQSCLDADGSVNDKNVVFTFGKGSYYKQLAEELQLLLSVFGIAARVHYCDDRINVVVMTRDVQNYMKYIGSRNTKKLGRIKNIHYKPSIYSDTVRIYDIEVTDEYVDMWDIIDSESHKFVVEGVVSHNSAAVITLRAMRNIYNNPRLKELGCKLIMSIHDENMCSVPKEHAYECAKLIEQCSIDAGKGLPVPLSCDVDIAENWYGDPLTFDDNHNLVPLKRR